jgi:DNA-binding transcriptional LysR family regulator
LHTPFVEPEEAIVPTFIQLHYFCTLARTGHFGRAAKLLNITQPPLSRQVASLEEELGTILFERTSSGTVPTPAGKQFLLDATENLRLVSVAKKNATAAGNGEAGTLTLGFTMCAAYSVVPSLTRIHKQTFPNVDLRLRERTPNSLHRDIRSGSIDMAISFPGMEALGLETRTLLQEPLDILLPSDHRLARARQLKVEDLRDEDFILVPADQAPSLHDSIVSRCEMAGFRPSISLEVYLQQTIVHFVAEGLGVAFVPTSMRRAKVEGTVFKRIRNPPMIAQVLAWSAANKNPCIAGLLESCGNLQRAS